MLNKGAGVQADNVHRQLVDHIYELKRDLEAVVQVFPHALALGKKNKKIRRCAGTRPRAHFLELTSRSGSP
jgi:hypothetical protein